MIKLRNISNKQNDQQKFRTMLIKLSLVTKIMIFEIDAGMDVDETKTTISFKDAYNFSKKGKVKVTVIVSDESNNKSTKHATVMFI